MINARILTNIPTLILGGIEFESNKKMLILPSYIDFRSSPPWRTHTNTKFSNFLIVILDFLTFFNNINFFSFSDKKLETILFPFFWRTQTKAVFVANDSQI